MKRLGLGLFVAALALATVPIDVGAKGSANYGRLTVRILGALGAERSVGLSDASPEQADALLGELDLAVSDAVVSSSPPPLSAYYQIVVEQSSSSHAPLPWAGKTAFFYFYPGRAGTPAYVRAQVGTGLRPSRDVWMIAFPGLALLIESHLGRLAPIIEPLPTLPPAGEPVPVFLWLGTVVAVAFLPALVVVLWPHIQRIGSPLRLSATSGPAAPGLGAQRRG